MPNEIAYYDDENGNRSYFADDIAREEIANKVKKLPQQALSYTCTSTNLEYTGLSVSCPTGHTYLVRAQARYSNAAPTGILASASNTTTQQYQVYEATESASHITFTLLQGETAYIWGKWGTANKQNTVVLEVIDITN